MEYENRSLFGGAFEISIPKSFKDLSNVREVPDNQEVFSYPSTDQCFIIEIVELVREVPEVGPKLMEFHFDQLAEDSDSVDNKIIRTFPVDGSELGHLEGETFEAYGGLVSMKVSKFREKARNTVEVGIVTIRIPKVESEILISFTNPKEINEASSSYELTKTAADKDPNLVQVDTTELLMNVVRSLKIRDWALFGNE